MNEEAVSQLTSFAHKHGNCFDRYLYENRDKLKMLEPSQLDFLLCARERCSKANSVMKFTRDDIFKCVREGTVKPDGIFATVCNDFLIADSFFE